MLQKIALGCGRRRPSGSQRARTERRCLASQPIGRLPLGAEDVNSPLISIDTSRLKKRTEHDHNIDPSKKSKKTPLVDSLTNMIRIRGPLTVASFMRQCLTDPQHGYYMRRDVFGRSGDFITSPEISQMFGELLGIWAINLWKEMGSPKPFRLIELGPGRGTLTADLMSVARKFRDFNAAIEIHFVEVSPRLREIQASKLGLKYPQREIGLKTSEPQPAQSAEAMASGISKMVVKRTFDPNAENTDLLEDVQLKTTEGIVVNWHQRLQDVPAGPSAIIAQEFFDALPVHQFEFTSHGWRERLIDIDASETGKHWFRYILAPSPTFASNSFLKNIQIPNFKVGDTVEVCPDAMAHAQLIGTRLSKHGGAAVIIDYGEDGAPDFSLRAIKDHKFVDIFEEPGNADLSINVDFASLRKAAKQSLTKDKNGAHLSNDVVVRGPITQGQFLSNMGIEVRLAKLLRQAQTEQEAEALISSFKRLIDPEEMGTTYKVLSIQNVGSNMFHAGFARTD